MSFFLIYNIAQYNIAHYFLTNEAVPLDALRCCRGLFWQNLLMRPADPRSPGLILAKSFVVPRRSEIPVAYSGKIFCCAPLVQDTRGLFWQNLLLSPVGPRSPGLIPTKSLAKPRWSEITGAYSNEISC